MMNKYKKIMVAMLTIMVTLGTINASVYAITNTEDLEVGEVAQNKSAKWADYKNGIAEITFDVIGKNAEEPLDVAIVYDNSGSMQSASKTFGEYTQSRWYYASSAAKLFTEDLLKNSDSTVAFVPFSDVLIDGTTIHQNPTDFFETHELLYDENGNPDIVKMAFVHALYGQVEHGGMTMDEFYQFCQEYYNVSKEQLVEKNNVQNAVVPFTKNKNEITSAIDSLYPSFVGQTNYEIALLKANELFNNSSNNKKVIVMISDGKPNVGGDSERVATELKNKGVTIYTCGTGISDTDAQVLKNIASKANGVSLYTPCNPSDLADTLAVIRKQLNAAATEAVIDDVINTDYFEYYTDETYKATVNGRAVTAEEFIVAPDNGSVTWKIGDINETKKTLSFYVKVKDTLLNNDALDNDDSLLNKEGMYTTNKEANLSYREINTGEYITTGHEMVSPSIEVATATLETISYVSDIDGNIIDGTILNKQESTKKALYVDYTLVPEATIVKDGITYYILEEDNHQTTKNFTQKGQHETVTYRYVQQMHVTFDTNGLGQFDDTTTSKTMNVDHQTMTVPQTPKVEENFENRYFIGWNTQRDGKGVAFDSTTAVKENMTVYAQYSKNDEVVETVNVTFEDYDGTVLKTDVIEVGSDATPPTNPFRLGYVFTGWNKEYTNVTNDLVVTATYRSNGPIIIPEDPVIPEGPTFILTPVVTTPAVATPTGNPLANPVVEQPVQPEQQDPITPDQVDNEEIIEDQEVPLGNIDSSWSLVNLICTVLTLIAGIFIILSKNRKEKEEDETTRQYKRRVWTKIAAAIVAMTSVVAFILTEDITLPMQFVDKWTMVMVALVLVQVIVVYIGRNMKDDTTYEENVIA